MRSRYVSYVLLSEKKLFLCLKKTKNMGINAHISVLFRYICSHITIMTL